MHLIKDEINLRLKIERMIVMAEGETFLNNKNEHTHESTILNIF